MNPGKHIRMGRLLRGGRAVVVAADHGGIAGPLPGIVAPAALMRACVRGGADAVLTTRGYSDWATQDIPSVHREMWYRISRRGSDFLLESSYDGRTWFQLRITHLHKLASACEIGVYACSPIGKDFHCCFKTVEISDNAWLVHPEAG